MMPYYRLVLLTLSFLMASSTYAQRFGWDLGIFSSGVTGVEIVDLEVDSDGNSYVLGNFSGTPDLNPGSVPALTKNSFSNSNLFLAKYDRTGALLYGRAITGVGLIIGTDLFLDGDDFVYITGSFSGFALIETGGIPGSVNRSSSGNRDIFLLKYAAASLLYQWDYIAGGPNDESGHGIAIDSNGDVFLTGGYQGSVDFDGPGPLAAVTSNGGEDIFLAKLDDATGTIIYRHSFGSTGNDRGQTIGCTSGTNLYIGGYFNGLMNINPGITTNIVPVLGQDGFVIRYDDFAGLGLLSSVVIGGIGMNEVTEIRISKSDLPYAIANIEQVANLGGGITRTSTGASDGVLMQYPVDLTSPNWATLIGGTGSDSLLAMTLDPCGNAVVAGTYQGTVDFNPDVAVSSLTGPAGIDAGYFVAKYGENNGSFVLAGGEEVAGRNNKCSALAIDPGGNVVLGVIASTAADTDVSVDGVNLSRTPPAAAAGTIAYLTRSATGNVMVDETAATGPGTLDEAMDWVALNTTPDTVCFCLSGTPPFLINKAADLIGVAADSTFIDGTTQDGWYLGSIILNGPGTATPGAGISLNGVEAKILGLTIQNYDQGIALQNSLRYQIGMPGQGNQLINNNYGLKTTTSYGVIQANEIGTNAAASVNLGNTIAGISFDAYPAATTIGGLGPAESNVIGFNATGVEDVTGTTAALIVGNEFACNTAAGIFINGGSFAPTISIAFVSALSGTGPANSTIHLYEIDNTNCGGTPPCQGNTYLGAAMSDALGNWVLPGVFTAGAQVTATATDVAGKTSEFALCNIVSSILEPAYIQLSTDEDQLVWSLSEDSWDQVFLEGTLGGMRIFYQDIQLQTRHIETPVSGRYIMTGILSDGRIVRSNAVEVQVKTLWRAELRDNKLTFGRPSTLFQAKITDSQGRIVWSGPGEGMESLSVRSWARGVYIIRMMEDSGSGWRSKVILR